MAFSRRRFLQMTGLTAGGALLTPAVAACGSGGGGEVLTSGPVDLDLWVNSQQLVDIFTHWAGELTNGTGPFDYTITPLLQNTSDIATKALAAFSARGEVADLLGLEITHFPRFATSNIAASTLLDITDRVADVADGFYRWEPYTVDGRRYGVETAYPLVVYYYRQDLFAQFGIPEDVETWEDLVRIGGETYSKHGVSLGAIGQPSTGDVIWFQMLYLQRGGEFFDSSGALALDSPEAVEVTQLIVDAVRNGTFLVISDFYEGPGSAALQQGRTAGYFMPDWFNSFILQPSAPEQSGLWRARPMPLFAGGGHRTSVGGGTGFAIPKDRPGTEAAWELLRQAYLTEEGQVWRFKNVGYLPTMKSAWENPELAAVTDPFLGGQELFKIFKSVADDAPMLRTAPNWAVVNTALGNALQAAIDGKVSAHQAIKDAVAEIEGQP
jgi:multiple sugar transport system substrate-binding protein/arabinosaccharide transport system substrate-binding protein